MATLATLFPSTQSVKGKIRNSRFQKILIGLDESIGFDPKLRHRKETEFSLYAYSMPIREPDRITVETLKQEIVGFPHNWENSRKKGLSLRQNLCLNVNR